MKYFRFASLAVLSFGLTSCGSLTGLMNTYPMRILDQTGSALMGYISENDADAPKSIEERARKVEKNGLYAGRGAPGGVNSSRQSMASR